MPGSRQVDPAVGAETPPPSKIDLAQSTARERNPPRDPAASVADPVAPDRHDRRIMTAGPSILTQRNTAEHERQDALFFAHQQALLNRDVPAARARFTEFAAAIAAHAAAEDAVVLPLHEAHGGDGTNSPPAQFQLEHGKIRTRLAGLTAELEALPEHADDRTILAMLDAESWFKSLLAHHTDRESVALYPRLDEQLDDTDKLRVLDAIDRAAAATAV